MIYDLNYIVFASSRTSVFLLIVMNSGRTWAVLDHR